MLAWRCLSASASPPARLTPPPFAPPGASGVSLPLPPPLLPPILTALSLGARGGAGFLLAGRLAGGAGGLAFPPALGTPFAIVPFVTGATTAGGGGGGAGFWAS